ncbi:hypothetical protein HW115_10430 [Verrucomicrobiaceae bacterium N1E253]|uniref:Uncharacterized protein n=1 Tax=Oceaniferula marina TaxID=2748318 RepID=A0A851GE34_9BACT|nr:hypothetical protein [Oceaniferula marina]NWK56028.1 hypothetical protein [Oceaniferula marina]
MKSCLSLILALVIVIGFVGTAIFLWYGSSTTEFSEGPFTDTPVEKK